jgi:glycosyltransferase involved in cell wall biosynthesis
MKRLLVFGLGFHTQVANVLYTGGLDIVVTYLYPRLPYKTLIFVRATQSTRTISFRHAENVRVNAVPVEPWRSIDPSSYWVAEGNRDIIEALDFVSSVVHERILPLSDLLQRNQTIVHAHDWMNAKAIKYMKEAFDFPSVFSVHMSISRPTGIDYLGLLRRAERGGMTPELKKEMGNLDRRLLFEAEGCEEADFVHCVSQATAESVKAAYCVPSKKVKVIYNGVDVELYHPPQEGEEKELEAVTRKYGLNRPFILSTGRFVAEKNHKTLLKAFTLFAKDHPDYSLGILGFGGYTYDELIKMRDALPDSIKRRVIIRNEDIRNDLPRLYRAAAICCFPSLVEAFGIVALEAMASGRPVVVGDVGGLKEVIPDRVNGRVGIRVNCAQPEPLAEALARAAEKADKMGREARKYVCLHFSWEKIALQFDKLYQKLF